MSDRAIMAYQLPAIRFPRCNLIFACHGQVDGVHHHTVPSCLRRCCWGRCTIGLVEESLVITRVMVFVESSRQAKVRQFDMSIFVDQDVVRFYVPDLRGVSGCEEVAWVLNHL